MKKDKYKIYLGKRFPILGFPLIILTGISRNDHIFHSEYFAFFEDSKDQFFHDRINFVFAEENLMTSMFNIDFIMDRALELAKQKMRHYLDNQYLEKKDISYLGEILNSEKTEENFLISIYIRNIHHDNLKFIFESTKSKKLKEYLEWIFKLPLIQIENLN